MVYSVEDRILIENLYKFKYYGAKNLLENFALVDAEHRPNVGQFLV